MSNVVEAPRVKQRHRHHACGLYIRWPNKGAKYQIRWWLGKHASINLGLYASEWLAEKVRSTLVKRVRAEHLTPLGMWRLARQVIEDLRQRGFDDLPDLLPKYARRRPDGSLFAKVTKGGRELVAEGPFETPEDAHLAMSDLMAREFPPTRPPARKIGAGRSVARSAAAAALALRPDGFLIRWAGVFTAWSSTRSHVCRVYRDELNAAIAADASGADAFSAVTRFRAAAGRAKMPTLGDVLRALADQRRARARERQRAQYGAKRRKRVPRAA